MIHKSFSDIVNQIKGRKRRRCAVVWAASASIVKAMISAQSDGIIEPLLIGNESMIRACIEEVNGDAKSLNIISAYTPEEAAQKAIDLFKLGQTDMIMKGHLETSVMMGAVINNRSWLQVEGIMSLLSVFEIPTYHKLLFVTDGGLILYPSLSQKKMIIENAVGAMRRMGISRPKVAILAAVESVTSKMPETIEARALKEMNEKGEIGDCIIEGPISYDIAIRKKSAELKGFDSEVAGDADLLVWPDITCGNIASKALTYSGEAKVASCVIGAKVLIPVASRGSDVNEKYMSMILAVATDLMEK